MRRKKNNLKYETKNYIYDFQLYETTRSFEESIYTSKNNIIKAEIDQNNLLKT